MAYSCQYVLGWKSENRYQHFAPGFRPVGSHYHFHRMSLIYKPPIGVWPGPGGLVTTRGSAALCGVPSNTVSGRWTEYNQCATI